MSGAHGSENRWTLRSSGAGMATSHQKRKHSVGWPPTRWADDIKRVAGTRLKEAAGILGYVQECTSIC
ncbi:jg7104 [Pararge aegeria aegeria]|uniref:Jg7104 protein n=1 Tax=Pararge aegeria aegeria TaxID=348720 RepID=A0A8S4QJX9_9NEOP|nr:jg7104 [Pararge aegeria aegeria]